MKQNVWVSYLLFYCQIVLTVNLNEINLVPVISKQTQMYML